MIENKEFQDILKKYPDDIPVAIAVAYNGVTALLYNLEVEGIKVDDMKAVIIMNQDLNNEYETLMNGAEVDEEIYRD